MGMFGNVDYYNGQALGPTNQGPMLGASGGNQPPRPATNANGGAAFLDLSQLRPVGTPQQFVISGDQVGYEQRFDSPAGPVFARVDERGNVTGGYSAGDPNGDHANFDAQGNYTGSFTPGKGSFWGDFKGNVLEDKNFMTFAAIAAGGALAGAYSGAGAAGAAGAEAELLAGAGIGAGGGVTGAAGGYAASGAGLAAGTGAAMSGLPATAAAGAGSAAAGAAAAAQQGMLSNATGIPQSVLDGLGGLGNGLFDLWNRNQMSNRQDAAVDQANANTREAGNRASRDILGAGERAAALSGFTPYNISGGLTGVQNNADGSVTQTMDPRLRGIQDQQLSGASGFFGSVNAGTPEAQSKVAYQNYLNWAKPAQEQQFAGLQNTMAKQGLLGLQVGTSPVPPVQQAGGQMLYAGGSAGSAAGYSGQQQGQQPSNFTVNPYYKDFAQGVALADLKNYENSIRFGQDVTAGQISLGQGMLNGAMGIDKRGLETMDQSYNLGNARSAAGARAGGFLVDAARESGRNLIDANQQAGNRSFDRANESASQDAMRNRSIWDAIWNNVL